MMFERREKPRRPILYAIAALLIAVAVIGLIELAGTGITAAHSGLGGKLAPAPDVAPARTKVR